MESSSAPLPQNLIVGLQTMVEVLRRRGIKYALIGGVATGFRSRPRYTSHLDFVLQVPEISLPALLNDLGQQGFTFDLATVIRQWQEGITTLSFHGVRVDWLKPMLPFYQHIIDTAREEKLLEKPVHIASNEGLIVSKLLSFRIQDQLDIQQLLAANSGHIDQEWIEKEWDALFARDDPRFQAFEKMWKQYHTHSEGTKT
jgi:hypothetical protein